jgi:hypothetical protein
MRRSLMILGALALVATLAHPASAVTRGGSLDVDTHPYVGLMNAYTADGSIFSTCSGALVAPDVFVTAGHCTQPPAARVDIWFDADSWGAGWLISEGWDAKGTPHSHPLFDPDAFFLYDLGVVKLDQPYYLSDYADLPDVGAVDEMGKDGRNNTVTVVGYGLNRIVDNPVKGWIHVDWDGMRRQADVMVVNTKGVAGLGAYARAFEGSELMAVSGDAAHGGGCFGDSGGPVLIDTDTIGAIFSFGMNANCGGIGGAYRIDQQDDLDFINDYIS